MDRNSIIGLVLIGMILIGYNLFFAPIPDPPKKQNTEQTDSLKAVTNAQQAQAVQPIEDSIQRAEKAAIFGSIADLTQGENQDIILKNKDLILTISTKGGVITKAQLPEYKTYGGTDLILFNKDNSRFNYAYQFKGMPLNTADLYFSMVAKTDSSVAMELNLGGGAYIRHNFTLPSSGYMIRHQVEKANLNLVSGLTYQNFKADWKISTAHQEKSITDERQNTTTYYRIAEDEKVDYIGYRKSDEKEVLEEKLQWVSLKQKFFNTAFIAEQPFANGSVSVKDGAADTIVKDLYAEVQVANGIATGTEQYRFYMGPNHFQTLKKFDIGLHELIPLGWGIFGWVNRFLVIPVFNWFDSFGLGYGLIILLLTLLIKLIIFPFTYKSYLSMAKMRVLKPEIDELKEKHKDPQKLQAEQLKLYQKAGVNPLGGCLPLVFQMPILLAMFNFFPSSIELRQQSFLWAEDLSTYDSIWDFGYVPFINTIYGDHVSLFTLLMTISTIMYTHFNNQMTGATGQMKYIGYIMPVMFLGILNNYSSGLSYYYFLSNIITFGQQYFIRKSVDDEKIHAQLQENKKKPAKQSAFARKLEEMTQKQQAIQKTNMQNSKKK